MLSLKALRCLPRSSGKSGYLSNRHLLKLYSNTFQVGENKLEENYHYDFPEKATKRLRDDILNNFLIHDDFITVDEETSLLKEIEPYMKRLRYEFDHWDNAIHGFKETERLNWSEENSVILKRARELAFPRGVPLLPHTHILDLSERGHIKPHIDSVRFCGSFIAGLSLLSDSVMRLIHEDDKTLVCDILLKRRSLYVMKEAARYHYTHEILPNDKSFFRNQIIRRSRRISVICRCEPDDSKS